jgi:AcrR family transcriptional regulator
MMDSDATKTKAIKRQTRPAKRRGEKQERSLQRKIRITDAAIEVLALHGIAGLTHRLVAQTAGVSLAATTYYFDTKFDIVAEASKRTLQGYSEAFHRAAARFKVEPGDPSRFRHFVVRLVHNAAIRDKIRALCWAEIVLDAHRHDESLQLTRQWFAELEDVWFEIAECAGVGQPDEISRSAIDVAIGLLLVTLALDLTPDQVNEILMGGGDPLEICAIAPLDKAAPIPPRRSSKKAAETREKIIRSAIDGLLADGAGAIAYRSIAARAGITAAGPFYHFPTIGGLLAAAQQRLFEDSKERYRAVAAEIGSIVDTERLIDRTATVLVREATQYRGENLASYAIWLQAARNPELRPMIWSAISDQYRAWHRLLQPLMSNPRPLDALLAFSAFVGKHVRILSTGSTLEDLALVRSEFAQDLTALASSDFWL